MILPPRLQSLPISIIHSIARFYVNKDDVPDNSTSKNHNSVDSAWLVLHDISHLWRTLALEHFCQKIELEVSARSGRKTFSFPRLPRSIRLSIEDDLHTSYRHVKKVTLVFYDIRKQPSHAHRQLFSMAWPENTKFPSARSLSIIVDGKTDNLAMNGNIVQGEAFDWVAQRIPTSLPSLQEVRIEHVSNRGMAAGGPELVNVAGRDVNNLFLTVLERVARLQVHASPACLVPNDQYLQTNPGLISLEYHCQDNIKLLPFILQRSALTLESLNIILFPMGLVRMLVFGDDDEPVVYPRLKRLEFSKHTDIGKVNTVRMDESVVPFPELRYLKWVGCYGFEDDTLFRANIDKLEYLNIDFSAELLDMLQKADIFGNGRASEIGCITANIIYNNHNAVNLDSCADHIANLISPKTRVVRTSLLFLHSNVATITSKSPYTGNITVLTLKSIALSLLQMIEIIQNMPQMTDLLCGCQNLDPEFNGCAYKTITDSLCDRHYPLSRSFKRWDTFLSYQVPTTALTTTAIVLAVLCPNLFRTSIMYTDASIYRSEVAVIFVSGFYSDQFVRLFNLFSTQSYIFY